MQTVTFLHFHIIFAPGRGHLEMVRLLLEARADKNTRDPDDGRTALMAAAARGHLRVVNFLLQVGADKEAATPDGDTALTYAAESGHLNVVYMLLEADIHDWFWVVNVPAALKPSRIQTLLFSWGTTLQTTSKTTLERPP